MNLIKCLCDFFTPWESLVDAETKIHARKYPIGSKLNYLGAELTVIKNKRLCMGPRMNYFSPCVVVAGYDANGKYQEIDAKIAVLESDAANR